MYFLLGVCNNVIKQQMWSQGWIQKIQKGTAQTLTSYIITIYFTEKKRYKISQTGGWLWSTRPSLYSAHGSISLGRCLSAMCYESVTCLALYHINLVFVFFFLNSYLWNDVTPRQPTITCLLSLPMAQKLISTLYFGH